MRSLDGHSGFAPDALTTFAHFPGSDLMYAPNASGVLGAGSSPCLYSSSLTSGSFRTPVNSRLSRSMMGRGVFAGTTTPYQLLASNPLRPDSEMVGISATTLERLAVVTASARILPDWMCGIALAA